MQLSATDTTTPSAAGQFFNFLKGATQTAIDYKKQKMALDLQQAQTRYANQQAQLAAQQRQLQQRSQQIQNQANNMPLVQGNIDIKKYLPYVIIGVPLLFLLMSKPGRTA